MISGAGNGLGKQYALLLASRGARVLVNDIGGSVTGAGSNADAATAVAEAIRRNGGEAIPDSNSVTSPEGGQAIVDDLLRSWGRVDIVINNADDRSRCAVRGHHRRSTRPIVGCALERRVLRDEAGMESDARAALRAESSTPCSAAGLLGAERMSNYGAAKTGLIG